MGCTRVSPGGCQGDGGQTRQHDQNPNIFDPEVAPEHGEPFASGVLHFLLPIADTLTRDAFDLFRLHLKMTTHIL